MPRGVFEEIETFIDEQITLAKGEERKRIVEIIKVRKILLGKLLGEFNLKMDEERIDELDQLINKIK